MELASPVQAQGRPSNARGSYATRAKREKIPRSTLWHRDHGRPSRGQKSEPTIPDPARRESSRTAPLTDSCPEDPRPGQVPTLASLQYRPPAACDECVEARDETAVQELASGIY